MSFTLSAKARVRTLADLNGAATTSVGTVVKPAAKNKHNDKKRAIPVDYETSSSQSSDRPPASKRPPSVHDPSPSRPLSLVDPAWESIDPTPDVHALFTAYNARFFWHALVTCEVRWSPRMTTCAGVCSYEGGGGLCSIRLSAPLLKLRPRSDLVETLLHEMIHAYLFVTENNTDRDGHGAAFHAHMRRINLAASTSISVYHTFHDEVRHHKQHWWRCEGACRNRGPFHGWVKRAMNRAPSKNDLWWAEHARTCGGVFVKVKEPPKVDKKATTSKGAGKAVKVKEPPKVDKKATTSKGAGSGKAVKAVVVDPAQSKLPAWWTTPSSSSSAAGTSSATPVDSDGWQVMASKPPDVAAASVRCPSCTRLIDAHTINAHLDTCLAE